MQPLRIFFLILASHPALTTAIPTPNPYYIVEGAVERIPEALRSWNGGDHEASWSIEEFLTEGTMSVSDLKGGNLPAASR